MNEQSDLEVWAGVSRRLAAVEALIPEPPPRRLVERLAVDASARVGWGRAFGEPVGRSRPMGRLVWSLVVAASILAVTAGAILVAGALFGPHLPGPLGRNGAIAYATWTEDLSFPTIDVVGADGRDPRTIAASGDDSFDCPAFSPDGRQIAYLSATGSLATVSVDGSGARDLDAVVSRQGGAGDRPFDWSPDSSAIAYSPDTLTTDGTGPLNALDILSIADGKVTRVKVASIEQVLDVAWAPDGRRIAILGSGGNTVNDRARSRLFTVRPDGTDLRLLTVIQGQEADLRGRLSWSPDSKRIAYSGPAAGGGQAADIFVMSADGREVTALTHSAADDYAPAWSPDGRSIAFVSGPPGGPSAVLVMGADGAEPRVVDQGPAIAGVSWSPDATRLLIAPGFSETSSNLPARSVAVDGQGPTIELPSPFGQCPPSWQRLDP